MASVIRGSDNLDSASVGKVLQVVQATSTASTNTSSTSWAAVSGASVTITPASTSSKIFIEFHSGSYGDGDIWDQKLRIKRGSTVVRENPMYGWSNTTRGSPLPIIYVFLDSPNTTSPVTYTLECGTGYHTGTWYINNSAGTNSILSIATEIGG